MFPRSSVQEHSWMVDITALHVSPLLPNCCISLQLLMTLRSARNIVIGESFHFGFTLNVCVKIMAIRLGGNVATFVGKISITAEDGCGRVSDTRVR